MAAGLGALGNDEVTASLDGAHGVIDLAAHVDDQHVGAVALFDHLGGDAQRGDEGGGAAVDDDLMVPAPRQPKPPASDTAVTNSEYETPPMPASMMGCSTPSSSVRRVRMGA